MEIKIEGLKQLVHLGVPETERAHPQVLEIDVRLQLSGCGIEMIDEVDSTVDYSEVLQCIETFSAESSWKLLEKFCTDLGCEILRSFSRIEQLHVSARKRVLPEIDCFSCNIELSRAELESL